MIFKSEHITQASGSIAGVTYARAKGGTLYRRARAIPVNPNTTEQVQVRAALTALVTDWINTLTPTQRASWDLYAQNVTVTNKLGSATHISGQNWFIAANTPRRQAAVKLLTAAPTVVAAPSTFDRGDFTTPGTPTLSAASGLSMSFTTADDWANETNSAMLIFQGRPRNPSRTFFNGPYRLIAAIEGDDSSAPSSPFTVAAATIATRGFPLVVGQSVRIVVAVTRADGRLTTRRSLGDIEVAA